jgi:hypothetical protein
MLPVLPPKLQTKHMTDFGSVQKLNAFRYSYQYILLKVKAFSEFEDKYEGVMLIWLELMRFS